ncbi:hypothetical protein CC78DRAFT_563594 [Lojkania enalia]|uniref:Uncharacterized protein n=1 Tax=Lojkania enalia TaxID=147567 RepID=A0A9P4ND04_9PLEO|nr:hypothetical protein CC78DRAFT_563594 [Didymosphaeria enalia]
MLKIENLDVSTVAGLIAAGVFIVQFIIPTVFPLILVGFLKTENSAATWSVVSRTLHASHWPVILRTDSVGVQGVRGSVRIIATLEWILLSLISVTSIVTPLGLYQTVLPQDRLKEETFSYAKDLSPMGLGTLPRRNDFGLSRFCFGYKPEICPWSETVFIEESNATDYTADLPEGYDVRIPQNITEIYSAGLSKLSNTVSSVFDIQWRTYRKVLKSSIMREGQPYLIGDYRHLSQLVLNDAWEAVAGLIVNTKTCGIGFRNHTTPPPLPFGSTWTEDILFIEPETECVDLNITLDFSIPLAVDKHEDISNLSITDHGGFANLAKDIPSIGLGPIQICEIEHTLLFDPGTEWSVPMYSCASASKASIKTVLFRYNGTESLHSLDIVDIKPIKYSREEDKPLWAVENWTMQLHYLNPIWGITLPEHANQPNISTARQEFLYLPGHGNYRYAIPSNEAQFLAGVDFYSRIMALAYQQDPSSVSSTRVTPDYSGASNLALYNKWQDYSHNNSMAARIINLIWTDISANAVVGIKSQLPSEPLHNLASKRDESTTRVQVPITVYTRRVRFHYVYGILAFLALSCSGLLALISLTMMLIGRATPSTMRRFLDQTSAGWILTTFLYTNDCSPSASRANWLRPVERKQIDLGGQYPRAAGEPSRVPLDPRGVGASIAGHSPVTPYGKLNDASISLHSLSSPQPYSPVNNQGAAVSYCNQGADLAHNFPYSHVPPDSGMLSPQGGGYS